MLPRRGLMWDDIEQSRNYGDGTLCHIDEQFRNLYTTIQEQVTHADELLETDSEPYGHGPMVTTNGEIVYHGGKTLSESHDEVFFVSRNRTDAEQYGPVTIYRVTDNIPVVPILWDQLAANYGFDIDLSKYQSWEQLDEDIDYGELSLHEAEYNAHQVLKLAYDQRPLIIGSAQDEEYGFFPSSHYVLQQIYI